MVSGKTGTSPKRNIILQKKTADMTPLQSSQYEKCLIHMNVSCSDYSDNLEYILTFQRGICKILT